MTYQIYKTEGIILSSRGIGEAGKIYSIYTRDFGRVDILAQGVRYLKSKLRYGLNTFNYIRMAFIRTRESFRLIDVQDLVGCDNICKDLEKLVVFSKITKLTERMIKGEEVDPLIWQELKNSFSFLQNRDLDRKDLDAFEFLVSLRILNHLGYIAEKKEFLFLFDKLLAEPMLKKASKIKPLINLAIENALRESHL